MLLKLVYKFLVRGSPLHYHLCSVNALRLRFDRNAEVIGVLGGYVCPNII